MLAWRHHFLRDHLPKGLYWRALLIIVAPIALMQITLTLVFLDAHWREASKRMGQSVAAQAVLLIEDYERDPTPRHLAQVRQLAHDPLLMSMRIDPGPLATPTCGRASLVDHYMIEALDEQLHRPVFYNTSCGAKFVDIRVPTTGGIMNLTAYRDRVQAQSGPWFIAWIIGATSLLTTVSLIFIRNQIRPIEQLAGEMERFGRDLALSDYRPRGAREVRQAGASFLDMRDRLRRHIDQRAQLLAGVSHDLRTPLTRLKLQFAMMAPSPELEAARADLADMEHALEDYLAFVRGQWTEAPVAIDLAALVRDAAAAAARGGATIDLALAGDEPLALSGRPNALKRALANLIDNAAAHGDHVRIETAHGPDAISIAVEDDGPGIAPDLYEDAFRPFSRLDETRTRNTKGVGLGLAIARDVARGHGGDVILGPSSLGGLRAVLRLPASPRPLAAA
jgi:two-component system osmolarity sensor histidine kinase EnvZ